MSERCVAERPGTSPRAPKLTLLHFITQRNDDEDAKEKLYVQATPILGITNFHGLQTTVVDQE